MKTTCIPKQTKLTPEGWVVWTCARGCGFGDTEKHGNFPDRIHPPRCKNYVAGIGDALAVALHKIGITKQRWSLWMLALKHWPEVPAVYLNYKVPGCGCNARQQALNEAGWKWQRKLNAAGAWFRRAEKRAD